MKKTILILAVLCCAFAAFCGGRKENVIEVKDTKPVATATTTTAAQTAAPAKEAATATTTTAKADAPAPGAVTIISTKTSPAAEVDLIKKTTFTKEEIEEQLKPYKDAGQEIDEAAFIESVVDAELINQAMERDNIPREEYFNNYVLSAVSSIAAQQGIEFKSQEEVEQFLKDNGTTLDDFASSLVNQFQTELIAYYVTTKYKDDFDNIPTPDDNTIMTFYDQNKPLFVSSEKIKLAHIFAPFSNDEEKVQAQQYLEEVYKEISSGNISFDDAVKAYSKDTATVDNNGVLGWVNKGESDFELTLGINTSAYHKELFTEDTFNKLFELQPGSISGVLLSTQGYHIFKVLDHMPEKQLAITDPVYPDAETTVYDFCKDYIAQAYQANLLQADYAKLVDALKKEAKVTIY